MCVYQQGDHETKEQLVHGATSCHDRSRQFSSPTAPERVVVSPAGLPAWRVLCSRRDGFRRSRPPRPVHPRAWRMASEFEVDKARPPWPHRPQASLSATSFLRAPGIAETDDAFLASAHPGLLSVDHRARRDHARGRPSRFMRHRRQRPLASSPTVDSARLLPDGLYFNLRSVTTWLALVAAKVNKKLTTSTPTSAPITSEDIVAAPGHPSSAPPRRRRDQAHR